MQELRFELAHLSLSGLAMGSPDKPLILALHGWLDNAASFVPLSAYLDDYYVVAIDLAGHGHSAHRAAGNHYHQVDFVQDLHELVESQGWQRFILLGHSMGGIIASLYASCFSEKISHLITIEAFGPLTQDADTSARQLRESIESRLKVNRSVARHPTSLAQTIDARIKAGDISREAATLLVERNVGQQDGQYYFKTDRRLRTVSSLRFTLPQAEAFMRHIRCPVLVIIGDKGFISLREALTERRSWLAHLNTAECAGHHHLHMDNPADVAQAIIDFLSQNAAALPLQSN